MPKKPPRRAPVSSRSRTRCSSPRSGSGAIRSRPEGWEGWDDYAPFYDWENARTLGREDVPFWQGLARCAPGRVLELGCGSGRVTVPAARTGAYVTGVDRSAPMLARARRRLRRARVPARLVRADIRSLPFGAGAFDLVMAPYGILQSLLRDADVAATLAAVARVLSPGGVFALDLVPDLPRWDEYASRTRLRGRSGGTHLTLVESVRQDRARGVTFFDQEYVERRGWARTVHRFSLAFRTLSVRQMTGRLARAGFDVRAVLGDYQGGPWHPRADVWLVLAARRGGRKV